MNFTKGLVLVTLLTPLAFNTSCATHVTPQLPPVTLVLPKTNLSPTDYAFKRMQDSGISKAFIDLVKSQRFMSSTKKEESVHEKVLFLNIFGFLARMDYSTHYSKLAVKKTQNFRKLYWKTLLKAETSYQVSSKTIASLLWVETQFGKHTGSIPMIEVYFNLLQADHPSVAQTTLQELDHRKAAALQTNANYTERTLEEKVVERSIKKSAWALQQLKSLDKMNQKGFKDLDKVKASYAGAFGLCQFIPTAYLEHSVSNTESSPDLYNMKDAILSVAKFLKDSGWDAQKPDTQTAALFEYNHAKGYGEVIQRIAAEQ